MTHKEVAYKYFFKAFYKQTNKEEFKLQIIFRFLIFLTKV